MRARQRALADKRPGAAEDARDELRNLGIAVRDRHGAQQYRVIGRGE
ncbi:CysS/YqeB C-terminal domain-containing protein [Gordonia paraffinivorans]